MYSLTRPSDRRIGEIVDAQSRRDFTYRPIGATSTAVHPPGYRVDHNRVCLGSGEAAFDAARRALCDWQHYRFTWIELFRPESVPAADQTVGVLARALGLWVLNACRIVYVIEDEDGGGGLSRRFAFAYGTLPEHAESGEERFQVEWRKEDDSVWYDLFAFSRPNQLFSRIAHPYVRRKQRQFARESMAAIRAAVGSMLGKS